MLVAQDIELVANEEAAEDRQDDGQQPSNDMDQPGGWFRRLKIHIWKAKQITSKKNNLKLHQLKSGKLGQKSHCRPDEPVVGHQVLNRLAFPLEFGFHCLPTDSCLPSSIKASIWSHWHELNSFQHRTIQKFESPIHPFISTHIEPRGLRGTSSSTSSPGPFSLEDSFGGRVLSFER